MTTRHTPKKADIWKRAWEIHHEHGHPEGYDGPCWGPTLEEREQAKKELS